MIPLLFEPTRPPRAHQWEALRRARHQDAFAYLMEMGTGKSKVAVDEMIQLYLEGVIDRVLISAGAGSYEDWHSKHLPENVPENVRVLSHLWQGGGTKLERDRLSYVANAKGVLPVLIMNIEAIGSSTKAQTVAENFIKMSNRGLFIMDESTNIKEETALRTIFSTRIAARCAVRRCLTGSPITKGPLDLWGQLKFLGIENYFASNFYSFRARFCITVDIRTGFGKPPLGGGPPKAKFTKKVTGYQNLTKLERLLSEHSYRVLKEDCLDLPPKIYEECTVEMTDEQRRVYKQMSQIATAEIRDGVWSSARNAMGRLMKLHQITLGHLVDEDGVLHGLPTNRPRMLCDLIEEAGDKIIIWCAYRRDVTLVIEELEKRFPDRGITRYDGLVSPEDRNTGKVAFQDGDASFFVGTAATGGIGVTLTASCQTIYYSNTYSLLHRLQSEDRNHRDGQVRPVTITDMICRNSVEAKIVRILREKREIAETVIGDEVTDWLKWMDT